MIGHELTALHGLDHAQTLAIILPSVMNEQRDQKHDKLIQYAERVWNITEGEDESRIDLAIAKTREFFEQMGVRTYLKDYQLGLTDIPEMIKQLGDHGLTQLGEHGDIDLAKSTKILEACV
jgi:NADP-dependent alcohol dehydrogenase